MINFDYLAFSLLVFLTISMWVVLAYIAIETIQRRRKRKKSSEIILGYVDSVKVTPEGIFAKGRLTEAGMEMHKKNDMAGMSLGFKPLGFMDESGVRLIADETIHSVSLDTEPGPYGSRVDYVGTQPEED